MPQDVFLRQAPCACSIGRSCRDHLVLCLALTVHGSGSPTLAVCPPPLHLPGFSAQHAPQGLPHHAAHSPTLHQPWHKRLTLHACTWRPHHSDVYRYARMTITALPSARIISIPSWKASTSVQLSCPFTTSFVIRATSLLMASLCDVARTDKVRQPFMTWTD